MRKSEVHAAESVSCLHKALNRLKDIWEEIGIPEDLRLQRTDTVWMHIKNLLDMMITEEESLRKRLQGSISFCRKELDAVCVELSLPPFEEEEGSTMLQLEKDIRTRLKVMLKQKSQRQEEFSALQKEEQELCDNLCTSPYPIDHQHLPSAELLQEYRQHLLQLGQEKAQRRLEFVGLKRCIVGCMEELEQLPDSSFEQEVVCEDEEAFCLTTENISAVRALLSQLEARKAENEAMCVSLRDRVQALWERLQVPQAERGGVALHMISCRKTHMDALEQELQRLEELKKKNIQNVMEAIRVEIALYWEKSFYSQEQRQAFTPYYSDDFSEEHLALHEAEVLTLKRNYEEHQKLYGAITHWENQWTLFKELEKKEADPSRFNNRGGALLREEKQKADLQKSLPKLEKMLKAQIDQWEEAQGRDFLVGGQKFLQYVEEQWELHHMDKEREKLDRQMKKSKQLEEDMLYGTSIRTPNKRRLAATPTPGKTRKLNSTASISSTPNSTLRSICLSPSMRPPLSTSKLGAGLRTPARMRTPRALDRNKENVPTPRLQQNHSIMSVASSYSDFTRDLSKAAKSSSRGRTLNSTITH